MYNVSTNFLTKIKEPSRTLKARVEIGADTLYEEDIISFSVESSYGSDNLPTIGGVVATKLSLKLINSVNIPATIVAKDIKPYVALEVTSGNFEWVPLGVFRATTGDVVKAKNDLTIECFDKMAFLDATTYESALAYPSTVEDIKIEITNTYGVAFAAQTLPSVVVETAPKGTVRQVIGQLALLLSTNAIVDREGKVAFRFINPTTFTLNSDNYINYKRNSDALVKISQLQVDKGQEEALVAGDGTGFAIAFKSDVVNTQAQLETIYNRIYPLEFYAYDLKAQGMPHIDVGDTFTFTEYGKAPITLVAVNHKLNYQGGLTSEFKVNAPKEEKTQVSATGGATLADTINKVYTDLIVAVNKATGLITGAEGGNVIIRPDENNRPVELLLMDTMDIDTAMKVWRWNINGLGYSSTGYDGPYTTAITADGRINADFITAGSMSAARITTGLLKSVNNASWIDLNTGYFNFGNMLKLDANGYSLKINSTTTVEQAIGDAKTEAKGYTDTQLGTFATAVNGTLDELQNQIDGSITTWFYNVPPTNANVPASSWTTTELKNIHLGDLYYDTFTGYAYRWQVVGGVYSWQRITDSDATKALADAAKAQDTADAKRRVFTTTPTTPYEVGDLWAQGATGELMRCKTTALTGAYVASHWEKASKYTDDTRAIAAESNAKTYAETKANEARVAAEAVAVAQANLAKTEAEAYADGIVDAEEQARIAQDTATLNAAKADAAAKALAAENAAKSYADTQLTNFATVVDGDISDLQTQIDGKITTWFYAAVPTTTNVPASTWTTTAMKDAHLGDLYYNTSTGQAYRWKVVSTTYSWELITDNRITTALANAATAKDVADSKRRVFGSTPTAPYDVNDLWVQGTSGDIMRCITASTTTYSAAHWVKAVKYTDDTTANANLATAKTYAETKASEARTAAETYATTKAEAERVLAEAYADGIVDAEEQARINAVNAAVTAAATDATNKANAALSSAQTYANTAANNAKTAAQTYADSVAEAKRVLAEAYADGIVSDEEQARIADVNAKLAAAKAYADSAAQAAEDAANAYIDSIAVQKEDAWIKSDIEPSIKFNNLVWIDTSVEPNAPKRWVGNEWLPIGATTAADVGAFPAASGASLVQEVADIQTSISNGSITTSVINSAAMTALLSGKVDATTVGSMIEQSLTSIRTTISQAQTTANNAVADYKVIESYMDFSASGLLIGKSDSGLKVNITNEELQFLNGNNKVAYVSGTDMNITNANITNKIKIGVHEISKHNANITILRWVGE